MVLLLSQVLRREKIIMTGSQCQTLSHRSRRRLSKSPLMYRLQRLRRCIYFTKQRHHLRVVSNAHVVTEKIKVNPSLLLCSPKKETSDKEPKNAGW